MIITICLLASYNTVLWSIHRHCKNFWAFTGPRIDFADMKHDYTQELYQSNSSFINKFRSVFIQVSRWKLECECDYLQWPTLETLN